MAKPLLKIINSGLKYWLFTSSKHKQLHLLPFHQHQGPRRWGCSALLYILGIWTLNRPHSSVPPQMSKLMLSAGDNETFQNWTKRTKPYPPLPQTWEKNRKQKQENNMKPNPYHKTNGTAAVDRAASWARGWGRPITSNKRALALEPECSVSVSIPLSLPSSLSSPLPSSFSWPHFAFSSQWFALQSLGLYFIKIYLIYPPLLC